MARPSKCTPEVIAKVCEALKLGVSWEAAGAHAGVDRATLTNWRNRGADGEDPFSTFLADATRARDGAEVRMSAIVMMAAQEGNVLAAQWWLERRAGWGKADALNVALTTTVKPVSEDETRAMLGAMATAAGQPEDS